MLLKNYYETSLLLGIAGYLRCLLSAVETSTGIMYANKFASCRERNYDSQSAEAENNLIVTTEAGTVFQNMPTYVSC